MLVHSSAQRWQAFAQSWQWRIGCFAHSSPHAWQISAQSLHSGLAKSLSLDMKDEASRQIAAQSMSKAMQRVTFLTSSSWRQAVEQWSHASAQALQAATHDW